MQEIHDINAFYAQVSELLLDDRFRQLKQQKTFNIFDVLKIARTEIRHSNMLAWLLDPNEDHGLGSRVLNELVLMLIRNGHIPTTGADRFLLAKYEDVTIYRERKNIDILIESVKDRFVICIENKIDTKDHSNQLNKYDQSVNEDYPNFQKVFLYLTPGGELPTEETNSSWACVDYGSISDCIEKATRNAPINEKVRDFIAYYQEVLRREIMDGDKKMQEFCREIYRQHKAVLDMIYEYRPDNVQNISDIVVEWLKKKDCSGEVLFSDYEKNQSKCYRRFRHTLLDKVVHEALGETKENRKSGWRGKNPYFYEIVLATNDNGNVTYGLKLTFCRDNLTEDQEKKLGEIYTGIENKSVGSWKDFKSTAIKSFEIKNTDVALEDEDSLKQEIFKNLNDAWGKLQKKVTAMADMRNIR